MTKYLFSSGSTLRLVESFKRSTQNLQKKKSADQEAQKMEPAVAWHRGPPAGFPLQRALLALVDQSQQKANTLNGAKLTRRTSSFINVPSYHSVVDLDQSHPSGSFIEAELLGHEQ